MNIEIIKSKIKQTGVYFSILYKTDGQPYTYFSRVSKDNGGLREFNKQIKTVESMNPEGIKLELYSFASKRMRMNPDEIIIYLPETKQQEHKTETNEFSGFGALGGVENYIQNVISARTAERTLEQLERDNSKLSGLSESQSDIISRLKDENSDLKILLREKDFALNMSNIEKNAEIDRIKTQNTSLQNYLPAIGTIAAKVMGLNGEELRGLLGLPEDNLRNQINEQETNVPEQKFEFKKEESYTDTATTQIKEINDLLNVLKQNNMQAMVNDIYGIFSYISKSVENLNMIKELIKE